MANSHPTRNPWQVTHGCAFAGRQTTEYRSWNMMIQRCHNPKYTHYHLYGGRGITVCQRWRDSFAAFLADVGPKPSPRHSLDRFPDPNGNYEPGNCRWVTQKEQMRNMGRNRLITFRGETLCMAAWAERLGFGRGVLPHRLRAMSIEEALTTPLKPAGVQKCSVAGCGRPCKGKGLCNRHYLQQRRRFIEDTK